MYSINVMEKEHENILILVEIVRQACCQILEGKPVIDQDFRNMIYLIRKYADTYHHAKEEDILFREMTKRLGPVAVNLIQHGMLTEHDRGRFHIRELENSLDRYARNPDTREKLFIITHACAWADLLERHIAKENEVVFMYAKRELPLEVMENIDVRVQEYGASLEKSGDPKKCLELLKELSSRYLTAS